MTCRPGSRSPDRLFYIWFVREGPIAPTCLFKLLLSDLSPGPLTVIPWRAILSNFPRVYVSLIGLRRVFRF